MGSRNACPGPESLLVDQPDQHALGRTACWRRLLPGSTQHHQRGRACYRVPRFLQELCGHFPDQGFQDLRHWRVVCRLLCKIHLFLFATRKLISPRSHTSLMASSPPTTQTTSTSLVSPSMTPSLVMRPSNNRSLFCPSSSSGRTSFTSTRHSLMLSASAKTRVTTHPTSIPTSSSRRPRRSSRFCPILTARTRTRVICSTPFTRLSLR